MQAMIMARMGGGHGAGAPAVTALGVNPASIRSVVLDSVSQSGGQGGHAQAEALKDKILGQLNLPPSMLLLAAASPLPLPLSLRLLLIGVADIARAIASGQKPQFTAEDKQQMMNSALEARGINPASLQVAPAVEDPSLHLQEERRVPVLCLAGSHSSRSKYSCRCNTKPS
jgi:hypothetical protein